MGIYRNHSGEKLPDMNLVVEVVDVYRNNIGKKLPDMIDCGRSGGYTGITLVKSYLI